MTGYTISAVLIVPAAQRDAANALAEAMGWGPDCYSVPLSPDGAAPVTHWGLHSWVQESFALMLGAAGEGQMPPELIAAGYPPEDFVAVLGALIYSLWPDMTGHVADVLQAAGLMLAEIEEDPS